MKKKKVVTIIPIFCLLNTFFANAQNTTALSSKDFNLLTGTWQCTLTYLDYSSNTLYSMPAKAEIRQIATSNQYIFYNTYPDEPKANSADTVTISGDGKNLDKETVKKISNADDGNIEITTELSATDGNDNKPALIRHTYIAGNKTLTIRKEIKFKGENNWIKRNEYNYTKQQ